MQFLLQPRIVVHTVNNFLKETYPNAKTADSNIPINEIVMKEVIVEKVYNKKRKKV